MEPLAAPREKSPSSSAHSADALLAQKRQIRALKRILIAKAEVRRLKSLMGRHRVKAG